MHLTPTQILPILNTEVSKLSQDEFYSIMHLIGFQISDYKNMMFDFSVIIEHGEYNEVQSPQSKLFISCSKNGQSQGDLNIKDLKIQKPSTSEYLGCKTLKELIQTIHKFNYLPAYNFPVYNCFTEYEKNEYIALSTIIYYEIFKP